MSETSTALCTATSQDLAAVLGGHALTKTVNFGALTLLGLIGTNHVVHLLYKCGGSAAHPQQRCSLRFA